MTAILNEIMDVLEAPGDCPGLLVCYSTHILGVILKISAGYELYFKHSLIHCRHLYSAPSSGTSQERPQPQRRRIMLF